MSKKFAVVLSGCGVYDGAEIHEAVLTLLAIKKNGGEYEMFAPDTEQYHVINHTNGEQQKETRNVLVESARIARGQIKALSEFDAQKFDVLIFPGGFGAAKNLSTFAFEGVDCSVNADVEKAVKDMYAAQKPIGALCIAPAVIAKILGKITVTIGQDTDTASAIENMNATHEPTNHGEVVVDIDNKIVTSPCYMLDATIVDIEQGANNVVRTILEKW